ncbi:unnamed protein product, partial [Phaeothamnion confervicola]
AVFAEFLNSALLAATTCSIVNAIANDLPSSSRRNLSAYLPPVPTVFRLSHMRLCLDRRTHGFASSLAGYYDRLHVLKCLAVNVANRAGWDREADLIEIADMAHPWRKLATEALATIEEFNGEQGVRAADCGERSDIVANLLARAGSGGSPCVDAFGKVRLPAWAERRGQNRSVRSLHAIFLTGEGFQGAAVMNVSEKGLGVLGLRDVSVGSQVSLLIKPGSSISGRIVWVNGARAGIELDETLPEDSPLL